MQYENFVVSMYKAYRLCLRHKSTSTNALEFTRHKATNMSSLCRSIWDREYIPKPSIAFIVTKPMRREVIAADFQDRVVQHWVVMRIEGVFESNRVLADNSFSCRVGKGNLAAVNAFRDEVFSVSAGYRRDCWVASFDFKSFFMSIDKRILYREIVALVEDKYHAEDKDILLYLIQIMTFQQPQEGAMRRSPLMAWDALPKDKSLYHIEWCYGLPIGNLWSQLVANFHNAPFMAEMRRLGFNLINYVDDFFVVVRRRDALLSVLSYIRGWLKTERGITLHPKKFYMQYYSKGIKVLGMVVKAGRVYISNRTIHNLISKVYFYNSIVGGKFYRKLKLLERFVSVLNSYLGLMGHFDTFNIRKRIVVGMVLPRWGGLLRADKDFTKITIRGEYKRSVWYRMREHRRHARMLRVTNLVELYIGIMAGL